MSVLKKNKSGIFLMELMLVVLFVLLSLTICVRIFFESQELSRNSYVLTNAVIQAENVAQLLKYDNGKTDSLIAYYKPEMSSDNFVAYFDDKFKTCSDKKQSSYKMVVNQRLTNDGLVFSNISFSDITREQVIYTLKTTVYTQEGGVYE